MCGANLSFDELCQKRLAFDQTLKSKKTSAFDVSTAFEFYPIHVAKYDIESKKRKERQEHLISALDKICLMINGSRLFDRISVGKDRYGRLNEYQKILRCFAEFSDFFVRPVEEFTKFKSHNCDKQIVELAQHLFGKYKLPSCLQSCLENERQFEWVIDYGAGVSPKLWQRHSCVY